MVTVEVSALVAREMKAEAEALGIPEAQVVARWLGMSTAVGGATRAEAQPWTPLRLYADYVGERTDAVYVPKTRRVRVTSGPLTGRVYRTPSAAAYAVVQQASPGRAAPQGNGWRFWRLTDTGERLDALRKPPAGA
jgi:hypothetical protein